MRIANSRASHWVKLRRVFSGSNLFSIRNWHYTNGTNHGAIIYVVYSYGVHFPLYVNWLGVWYENADKFPRTTERHRILARPDRVEIVRSNTVKLRKLIDEGVIPTPTSVVELMFE